MGFPGRISTSPGTAWGDDAKPYRSKGPTGIAVRTLLRIVDRASRGNRSTVIRSRASVSIACSCELHLQTEPADPEVSSVVDSRCPRLFTLVAHAVIDNSRFLLGFLKTGEWHGGCNSRGQLAKGCESPYLYVLAPSNAARGIFPAPLWHPPSPIPSSQ